MRKLAQNPRLYEIMANALWFVALPLTLAVGAVSLLNTVETLGWHPLVNVRMLRDSSGFLWRHVWPLSEALRAVAFVIIAIVACEAYARHLRRSESKSGD